MSITRPEIMRDRRIRRQILKTLYDARSGPEGGLVKARFICDEIIYEFRMASGLDDRHMLGLFRDLVKKGLATEHDDRTHKSQVFGLDWFSYAVTGKGVSLVEESIPADPDIDDDRIDRREVSGSR